MFGAIMNGVYWTISWILLHWHSFWVLIVPSTQFLGTNWDWILAIVFLVLTVRVVLFPVFVKQIKSQRAMQALQPKMKALQEKHKGDKEALQREMMILYREEKVNPLMGCLPMFLQIPVFLGLFHVLKRLSPTVEPGSARATLYGWTYEQFHNASLAHLFGAPIASSFKTGDMHTKIVAGVLVLIMMATTYMTSRQMILKTGWNEDPTQRMIQKLMLYGIPASLFVSGFLYPFPIGVVIYWVTQNLFSLGQQYWVLHKYPPPVTGTPVKKAPSAKPGVTKTGAAQPKKAGIFGKTKAEPAADVTAPATEGKALAPKPGAKPVNPKKGGPKRQSG